MIPKDYKGYIEVTLDKHGKITAEPVSSKSPHTDDMTIVTIDGFAPYTIYCKSPRLEEAICMLLEKAYNVYAPLEKKLESELFAVKDMYWSIMEQTSNSLKDKTDETKGFFMCELIYDFDSNTFTEEVKVYPLVPSYPISLGVNGLGKIVGYCQMADKEECKRKMLEKQLDILKDEKMLLDRKLDKMNERIRKCDESEKARETKEEE